MNQERNRRKALRVIPRGKHRLTVYRAHQVTRRAFLALRVIRLHREFRLKVGVKKSGILIRKMKISLDLCVRLAPDQFSVKV